MVMNDSSFSEKITNNEEINPSFKVENAGYKDTYFVKQEVGASRCNSPNRVMNDSSFRGKSSNNGKRNPSSTEENYISKVNYDLPY